jgi:molybdopterin/thiamine biosynthesis adenylyltransferase
MALDSKAALHVTGDFDVVLDCTDNVATRFDNVVILLS